MLLFRLLAAVLIGLGLYALLNSLLHPYSTQAARALQRLTGRKTTWYDRLIAPLARRITPLIHLSPYRQQELSDNLMIADNPLTPEQYTAQNVVTTGLIILWGFILLPANYLATIALAGYAVYWYQRHRSGLTAEGLERLNNRTAELPRFASYLVQSVKERHDLYPIVASYRPTAGPGLGRELDTLLINMRTGNVEAALQQFAVRMGIPIVSDLVMGLISASHGEDVQDYLQSLETRIDQMDDVALDAEVEKRQSLFTLPNYLMLFSMIAVMMTALGVYAYQLYRAM